MPAGGIAPYCLSSPLGVLITGPKRTSPDTASKVKCLSFWLEVENSETCSHRSQPDPSSNSTSTVSSGPKGSAGSWSTAKACPDEPSLVPSTS